MSPHLPRRPWADSCIVDADFAVHKYVPRGIDGSEGIKGPDAVVYQLGTAEYSLPAKLAPFVGHVNPGSDFRES